MSHHSKIFLAELQALKEDHELIEYNVKQFALWHDVTPTLIYKWIRDFSDKNLVEVITKGNQGKMIRVL